ncbi:DinB family protein [Bacillus weihaiensis]|uniref:DinB-like domain-containing protein n=1 Tax=Bacillus weihaiensis TaxID=1547283 RepID=A0A1L3MVT3_9BACI|nr:DinB family protein [Bacillus weihaiensis]APH06449.1 hypothetical protein A9C19_17875 [Bacillus weihaiensis]
MSETLFSEMRFIRQTTFHLVRDLSERQMGKIPDGFPHNIHWNLGHIYVVGERFYGRMTNSEPYFPQSIWTYFNPGTAPSNWDAAVPSIEEIISLLKDQLDRYVSVIPDNLAEPVNNPYTTSSGYTLNTGIEFYRFSFYHEGMHIGIIKSLKKFV